MTSTTLDEVFGTDDNRWSVRLAGIEPSETFADVGASIASKFAHLKEAATAKAVVERIPDLLRLDFGSLLVGAWSKYVELQKYRDKAEYPPDETILVDLAKHTISSTHTPHLDVMVGESVVKRIDFTLELALEIDGAVLTVRDGKIWSVSVSSCQGSGELSYKDRSLLKRETRALALPGRFDFTEPVTIPGPSVTTGTR